MSGEWWAPQPLRELTLNGIFSHSNEPVEKSNINPYSAQRAKDGTPHTVTGRTSLRPAAAGPKLVLEGLSKAQESTDEPMSKKYDADAVVKAFLSQGK